MSGRGAERGRGCQLVVGCLWGQPDQEVAGEHLGVHRAALVIGGDLARYQAEDLHQLVVGGS